MNNLHFMNENWIFYDYMLYQEVKMNSILMLQKFIEDVFDFITFLYIISISNLLFRLIEYCFMNMC